MGVLRLTIQPAGGGAPSSVSFDQAQVMLGRSSRCEIRLPFQIVSSHHLTFSKENGQYKVVDVGSTNGTFLNNVRLLPNVARPIGPGNELRIVDLTIRVDIESQLCEGFTLAESTTMLRQMMSEVLRPKNMDDSDTALLEVVSGFGRGKRVMLPDELDDGWIGSAPDSLVQIHQPGFPARIGEIKRNGDGYGIQLASGCCDLIRVNGAVSLEFQPLRNNDRLYVGNMELVFLDPLEEHLAALDHPLPAAAAIENSEVIESVAAVEDVEQSISVAEVDDIIAPEVTEAELENDGSKTEAPKRKPLGLIELGLIIISSLLMLAGIALFLYVLEII